MSIENNNTETCNTEVDFGIDDIELKPVHKDALRKTDDILFQTGSDKIDSFYVTFLTKLANEMIQNPTLKLYIKGYTDNQDDFEFNLDLSKRRSVSVKNYLICKGISATRFTTDGFGETRPVASNDTSEGRKQNRRAEIYLIQ